MPKEPKPLLVGLVMPIAPMDDCSAEHWSEVKDIISDAVSSISDYAPTAKLVSEADSIGVIHKRIVQGLYSSDVIICDVSCKNANVMFELGMRLAFDKPTVIIKDSKTSYSFDTSGIEHLEYPRDLRFGTILKFKDELARRVKATWEDSLKDPEHSPFLKNFGQFKVAKINQTEVPAEKMVFEMLSELQSDLTLIKRNLNSPKTAVGTKYKLKDSIVNEITDSIDNYCRMNNFSSVKEMTEEQRTTLAKEVVQQIQDQYPGIIRSALIDTVINLIVD